MDSSTHLACHLMVRSDVIVELDYDGCLDVCETPLLSASGTAKTTPNFKAHLTRFRAI